MSDVGEATVLARTMALEAEVGSNLRGEMSGAGWLYALPRLGFRTAVCVGTPPDGTLTALVRSAGEVVVIDPSSRRRSRTERLASRRGWTALRTQGGLGDGDRQPDDDAGIHEPDLVVATGRLRGEPRRIAERLIGHLAPDGVAVLLSGPRGLGPSSAARRVALTPARGEVRSVVPADDAAMRATIHRLGLEGTILVRPRPARVERAVRRLVPFPWSRLDRSGILIGGRDVDLDGETKPGATRPGEAGADAGPAVPAYVREMAAAAGRDLTGWRWGVAARGDYDTQKVLVLLTPPGATDPTGVVKVTRSAAHAARLENEAVALAGLAAVPEGRERAPQPWFSGRHAGRALLGESFIEAVPFAQRAHWDADCPQLDDALGWLTALGAATRRDVAPRTIAATLGVLLDRYVATYAPSPEETAALSAQFEALAAIDAPLPTVLQHGDPGIWNLVVDEDGRTVFLDWESAEPDGLPLWDLLYCFRSYAAAASRRSGARDRIEAAGQVLLDGTPLSERLIAAVAAYRDAVGLPVEAVEPLIYACWLHRSLKEATRLSASRLAQGTYVRLVRRMIARPDAPVLMRLGDGAT